MKIIHFADLHLGVESYGRLDPETGVSSRTLDFLAAFDQVADYALKNRVDLILFCGDAYHRHEPSQTQQRELARRINRLSTHDIPVLLLAGNHDMPGAAGKATSTEIFATLAVKNVYVSSRPDIHQIPTHSGTIQVASLPWLRRNSLLSRENTKNLSFEEINQKLQQVLTNIIATHADKIKPELPSVLAAHVWVAGAQIGSERLMTIGQEHVLLLSNVANPAFDYIALGHIHKHQVLSENPPVVYAGSLERVDFSEEGDDKGFYEIELAPDKPRGERLVSLTFHPLEGRRFLTINAEVQPEDENPTQTVLQAIAAQGDNVKDAVVRLLISLPEEASGQIRDSLIRDALKEAYYATTARDIRRQARLRLGNRATEETTPLDALKSYLEDKNVPPERTRLLLEYGERLIQEQRSKEG